MSDTAATITQVATNDGLLPDEGSLLAKVKAGRQRSLGRSTIDIEIPGYDGTLWGTFRALDDYGETKRMGKPFERIPDEADREVNIHAATLLRASVDVFVPLDGFKPDQDGCKHSLGCPLGAELAGKLGLVPGDSAVAVSDHEAVFLIFPNTLLIGAAAIVVNQFSARSGRQADEELEGNS